MQISRVQSWPRLISTYKDIPPSFASHIESISSKMSAFPYTIYLPSYSWDGRETNELLLCLSDDKLDIFEQTKAGIQVTSYSFENIIFLNRGTMLLYSWVKIVGLIDGEVKATFIEFNTVTEGMFEKMLTMIRLRYNDSNTSLCLDQASACSDKSPLGDLEKIDYKFMNYGKKGILPGQPINYMIFQPVIKAKYMRFFNKLISKAHLHLLSDGELIVIKEDNPDVIRFKTKKYLVVWHYIPLCRIKNMAVEENDSDLPIMLNIELTDEINLASYFDMSNKKSLTEMIRHVGF